MIIIATRLFVLRYLLNNNKLKCENNLFRRTKRYTIKYS